MGVVLLKRKDQTFKRFWFFYLFADTDCTMNPSCSVCLEHFEVKGTLLPRLLPCNHSFCDGCLRCLFSPENTISCPECRTVFQYRTGFPVQNKYILAHLVGKRIDQRTIMLLKRSVRMEIRENQKLQEEIRELKFKLAGQEEKVQKLCADTQANIQTLIQKVQDLKKINEQNAPVSAQEASNDCASEGQNGKRFWKRILRFFSS